MNFFKIILIAFVLPFSAPAKDYNASLFGAKSDGLTLNTRSIQKGIDYISENGGGTLVFHVGRYLTGSIQLKSNVSIKLEEGAVLVGSGSIYDYNSSGSIKAIICADGQQHIGISGKGVIEGRSALLLDNMTRLKEKGFLLDSLMQTPALLGFSNCTNLSIDSVNLWDAAGAVQVFRKCTEVKIDRVTIKSKNAKDAGNIFMDNTRVRFLNSYVEVPGKALQWSGVPGEIKIEGSVDKKGSILQPE
ncbi:MAG: endopygalactorunase [Chitinophagaceae bacterium]|nr:endopygalactorunase [Chitinophagaceae bacterium]